MDKFKNMQVFCRIVELGTFTAVAKEMEVSPMMISKYMRHLENSLGISLINRTTRQLNVTDSGKYYYQKCKQLLEGVIDLDHSMKQSIANVSGILKVNAPIDFGGLYMVPVIHEYRKYYPDVHLLMSLDNAVINLRDGRFDLSIVVTDRLDSGVVARKIASTSLCTYASPGYLDKYGRPETIEALEQHSCLHYLDSPHENSWIFNLDGEDVAIKPNWVFASNNGGALCQAAALGMGVVRSPSLSVQRYIESGELVEILEDCRWEGVSVCATYLQHHYYPAKMSTFIDFLTNYFSD